MENNFALVRIPHKSEIQCYEGPILSYSSENFNFTEFTGFICGVWSSANEIIAISENSIQLPMNEIHQWISKFSIQLKYWNQNQTSFTEFESEIIGIQNAIRTNKIEKAVASRCAFLESAFEINKLVSTYIELCNDYPNAFICLFYSEQFGLWLGASPEILMLTENDHVTIMSLAGTLSYAGQEWTEKERLEQSVTSKFIKEKIGKFGISDSAYQGIEELNIGGLKHLRSDFKFNLPQGQQWQLLTNLNPTPAVCGYPQQESMDIINELENFDRQLFTGFWGVKTENNLYTFVNLRCSQQFENGTLFYAGCGINQGSNVENEWIETEAKMNMTKRYFS